MNKELIEISNDNSFLKLKFFVIFKLIISIIYFIPAFLIFGLGFLINIFLLIIGAGSSKTDGAGTNGLLGTMTEVGLMTIIPSVIAIIVFILAIISCVRFFKGKYSKKLDLIICILMIIINILYIIFMLNLSFMYLPFFILILTILIIINIFIVLSKKKIY